MLAVVYDCIAVHVVAQVSARTEHALPSMKQVVLREMTVRQSAARQEIL